MQNLQRTFWTYGADKSLKIDNPQQDLMYFESLFAATGFNLNDDVFTPDELWKARKSPVYKPVDVEHEIKINEPKESVIVGSLIESSVEDKDGKKIDKQQDEFAIISVGCVWQYIFRDVAANIKKLVADKRMFVSMEAWFNDYDYAISGEGVVKRNEKTSFLDKSLKAYGGNGKYKGKRIGRVLRNIIFGGVGFVEKPAEPKAIVRSVAEQIPSDANKVVERNVIECLDLSGDNIAYILSRLNRG